MILQSLVRYYEALAERGEIPRPGWAKVKVSYALEIDREGSLLNILPLKTPSADGKRMFPRELPLPAPVKRTVGIDSNFLWDNAAYILGLDCKGDKARSMKCFEAAKDLHKRLLCESVDPFAQAVFAFFEKWSAAEAESNPQVAEIAENLVKGENLTFLYENSFPDSNNEMGALWQKHYDEMGNGTKMRCLVTGSIVDAEEVHPPIKGVRDSQSSGAALVSFNAPAYCSYGREQNINAPVGKYAAFAYTSALNYLLSQRDAEGRPKYKLIGNTTAVYWAEDAQPQYQSSFASLLDGDGNGVSSDDIGAFMNAIVRGEMANWDGLPIKPDNHFYVLGLSPNAARLSVRFFIRDSFGSFVRHLQEHYKRLEIVTDNRSKWQTFPLWALMQETVNQKSRDKTPSPQMAGDVLRAILAGGQYPATLYQQTQLRIRAERDVTRGRAAIIKAYLLRNTDNEKYKEALTVELNEQTNYQPYLLGRLFSLLEAIQQRANPGINATIKDKYFSSACATPAVVFPSLVSLTQKHLRKLDTGAAVYYSKQLGGLMDRLVESYPAHLTLYDQGIFQLGYYHQTQKRYEKTIKNNEEAKKND